MSERYTPKIGDNVVLTEDFRQPAAEPVVYVVEKINQKTITLRPLSGVGRGVRVTPYGVEPATEAQTAEANAIDPASKIALGSIVTMRNRKDQLFVVIGENSKSFKLAELNGDASVLWKASGVALTKVQIDQATLLSAAA